MYIRILMCEALPPTLKNKDKRSNTLVYGCFPWEFISNSPGVGVLVQAALCVGISVEAARPVALCRFALAMRRCPRALPH